MAAINKRGVAAPAASAAIAALDAQHAAALQGAAGAEDAADAEAAFGRGDAIVGEVATFRAESFAEFCAKGRVLDRQFGGQPVSSFRAIGEEEQRLLASMVADLAAMVRLRALAIAHIPGCPQTLDSKEILDGIAVAAQFCRRESALR